MKSIKTYLSFLFVLFILNVFAQHSTVVDTLTPKNKLDNNLQKALLNYKFETALKIADSMEYLGITTKDTVFLAYVYDIKSTIYNFNGNSKKGKLYATKMVSIYKQKKYYSLVLGSYSMLASILRKEGKADSSLYVLNKAQKFLSDTISVNNIVFFYNQKALSHYVTGRIDSSLHYSFKRLKYLNAEEEPYKVNFVYKELAKTFFSIKDYQKALLYIDKSLELIDNNDKLKISKVEAYTTKANIYIHLNEFTNAYKNLDEAQILIGDSELIEQDVRIKIFKAQILKKQNKLTEALEILQEIDLSILKLSKQTLFDFYITQATIERLNQNWSKVALLLNKLEPLINKVSDVNRKHSFYELSKIYYGHIGDYEKGYSAQSSFSELSNKIKNRQQTYIVYELEKKYQLTKKEEEIALQQLEIQKKRTQYNYMKGIAIFLLLTSILTWLIFKQRQKRKNQELLVLKNEAQINSLESLIEGEEKERLRIAKELHDGVNGDLSAIKHKLNTLLELNNKTIQEAVTMIDKSCEQVRAISHNLVPPALENFDLQTAASDYCANMNNIHKQKISFSYLGDQITLPKIIEINIFRIIQELITNSIKHAEAKSISVQLSVRGNDIQLAVEDDGKGFDMSEPKEGVGISNIKHRVNFLNGEIDFTSNNDGTFVNILMDKTRFDDN